MVCLPHDLERRGTLLSRDAKVHVLIVVCADQLVDCQAAHLCCCATLPTLKDKDARDGAARLLLAPPSPPLEITTCVAAAGSSSSGPAGALALASSSSHICTST